MLDLVTKLWHTLHTSTESPAIMEIINQLLTAIQQIEANVPTLISLIASAWVVQVANMFLGYRLNLFGIIPRHVIGLPGILVSPWLHGSINHIFMNSLFFFAMAGLVSINGMQTFTIISISIMLISGSLVWLFARLASHVGASSLIMGYWSFIMVKAYFDPQMIDVITAALGMYYFGVDLLASVAPGKGGVSVEGHVSGLIAGAITATWYAEICNIVSVMMADLFGVLLICGL